MHVAPTASGEVRAGVFLKNEHLALVAKLLDLNTDTALGRTIGMDPRTISRARTGVIGEPFIAALLSAFAPHAEYLGQYNVGVRFEDFFAIGDKQAAA